MEGSEPRQSAGFEPKDHLDLGVALDVIDTDRASRTAGSRFAYLKGDLTVLWLGLVRFAIDVLTEHGFTPVIPPVLVRREAMEAQAAALGAKAIFARLGAEAEIRNLANQEWDPDFAAKLGRSLEPLHEAQELADAGRYAQLVTYLNGRSQDELEQSPMLALLFGIAHSRLGRLDLGRQWARVALSRARVLGDRKVEVRALNVCGAVALERGGIDQATHFFTRAQEEESEEGTDEPTFG